MCWEVFGCDTSSLTINTFCGLLPVSFLPEIVQFSQINFTELNFSECYIIPSPGRCSQSQRRNFFTYSPKVNRCVRLRGCYSVKDRNVFLSNEGCDRTCSRNSSSVILDPEYAGMDIASGEFG